MRSRVIAGNKKPIVTEHPDVNRALADVYDSINHLSNSVNNRKKEFDQFKGVFGDLRVNDEGFQYHNGKGWQTLAVTGADSGDDLPPIVASSFQASGIRYPVSDGTTGQSVITNGAGRLSFASHLALTGGSLTGDLSLISGTSQKPELTIENTTNDTRGGLLKFLKDKGAAASTDDVVGKVIFSGDNSAQEEISYGDIRSLVAHPTDTDEAGKIIIRATCSDGSTTALQNGFTCEGTGTTSLVNATIGYGASSVTTIAGTLDIDGSKQTTAGNFELETTGHFVLDSGNDITLDSNSGDFIAARAGTEFSAANSAYAGMILGYTALGADANATYYAVTNAYAVISDDHKITFTAPPSGKVEIEASCYMDIVSSAARPLYLSLSTANATTGYASLDVQHEHIVAQADETDSTGIINKWVLESLTPGSSYTFWVGTKCTHSSVIRLYWGGDTTGEYAPFIVKATALPATIYDG
tara:strand:- start:381 stop:1790 length:1410 start_codon:yes stop_codon:yes gene_type:complete